MSKHYAYIGNWLEEIDTLRHREDGDANRRRKRRDDQHTLAPRYIYTFQEENRHEREKDVGEHIGCGVSLASFQRGK